MIKRTLPFPIQFHFLFWLLFAGAIITGQFVQLLTLFSIVLIHELGHIIVARFYYWQIAKLTVLPFGGVVDMHPPGRESAREEFWITIAGPCANGIAILLTMLACILGIFSWQAASIFLVGNGAIALFNLLPIYPLDGGRIFQIILSLHIPFRKAIVLSLYWSLFFIALCVVLSFSTSLTLGIQLWMILPYLALMIFFELRKLPYRFMTFLLARHSRETHYIQPTAYVHVKRESTIKEGLDQMYRHRFHLFKPNGSINRIKGRYYSEKRLLVEMFDEKRPLVTFEQLEQAKDRIDMLH